MADASGQALSTHVVGHAPHIFRPAIARMRCNWKPALALVVMAGLVALTASFGMQWFYLMCGVSAGGLAVVIAWRLSVALRASEQNAAELMEAYTHSRRELEQRERSYRRRLHDARSTTAGIRAAIEVIGARPGPRTDDVQRLRWCALSELNRLQELLDADGAEADIDFDLTAALEPIVLAHRVRGTAIELVADNVRVHGRPRATSGVLDNLLRNVELHAPGAQVRLRITWDGPRAVVVVDDDGPGIPPDIADRALLPGVRGAAVAAGSGLGLYSASTAIIDQSGTLRVGAPPGGGTRVTFTLPAVGPASGLRSAPRLAG